MTVQKPKGKRKEEGDKYCKVIVTTTVTAHKTGTWSAGKLNPLYGTPFAYA